METITKKAELTTVQKLEKFVNQRSGIEFREYAENWRDTAGVQAFKQDQREIAKDRQDFYSLFNLAIRRIGEAKLNEQLTDYLKKTGDRLILNDKGNLEYHAGQYSPTEYRPAASRVLANLIFADYRDEVKANEPNPVYTNGNEIRKAISKHVSRRVMKNYFN